MLPPIYRRGLGASRTGYTGVPVPPHRARLQALERYSVGRR